MHELQLLFASEEGEAAWTQRLQELFAANLLDEAEALLAEALTALDTELAWDCLELPREAVELVGWQELDEAILVHEGAPVSGVTIAIANETDRDFDKGRLHRPHVLLGAYTDEAFAFSTASRSDLLAEVGSEIPAWAGREEDIEVHLDIEGLDSLNTKLLHHKQRHIFRDSAPAEAPLRYVEFVLACWWRALRWHQAVTSECIIRGLANGIPVIAGTVAMRAEAMTITTCRDSAFSARTNAVGPDGSGIASLFGTDFIRREALTDEPMSFANGPDIRRRALSGEQVKEHPVRPGFLARLFARRHVGAR